MTSSPLPPVTLSSPANAQMTSLPLVPLMVSLPVVPMIVHPWPLVTVMVAVGGEPVSRAGGARAGWCGHRDVDDPGARWRHRHDPAVVDDREGSGVGTAKIHRGGAGQVGTVDGDARASRDRAMRWCHGADDGSDADRLGRI